MDDEKDVSTLVSRRSFVGGLAAAAGFMIVPRHVLGGPRYQAPSDRVQVATVGYINGMGTSNTNAVGKVADVVALCDVDESAAAMKNAARTKIFETFPNGGAVQGLPRDAREAEGHRRRHRRDAGP